MINHPFINLSKPTNMIQFICVPNILTNPKIMLPITYNLVKIIYKWVTLKNYLLFLVIIKFIDSYLHNIA